MEYTSGHYGISELFLKSYFDIRIDTVGFPNFSHLPYRTLLYRTLPFFLFAMKICSRPNTVPEKTSVFFNKNVKSANRTAPKNIQFSVLEPLFLVNRELYRVENWNDFYLTLRILRYGSRFALNLKISKTLK